MASRPVSRAPAFSSDYDRSAADFKSVRIKRLAKATHALVVLPWNGYVEISDESNVGLAFKIPFKKGTRVKRVRIQHIAADIREVKVPFFRRTRDVTIPDQVMRY